MTRVKLNEATVTLLRGLKEPVELCDESGDAFGTFTPAEGGCTGEGAEGQERRQVPETDLGPEMGVYGYERDLE